MDFTVILGGFVSVAPSLVIWSLALVLSIILLKRGGTRTERFLVWGSALILVNAILRIPVPAVARYLITERDFSNVGAASFVSGINVILGLISLAGVVFLFYAVWKKFSEGAKITAA